MASGLDVTRASYLVTLTVASLLLCGRASSADLGFRCIFGTMITTTTPEGAILEYCPTQMQPAVMVRGQYLVADKDGACFECMCEPDTGLACCECTRPRVGR